MHPAFDRLRLLPRIGCLTYGTLSECLDPRVVAINPVTALEELIFYGNWTRGRRRPRGLHAEFERVSLNICALLAAVLRECAGRFVVALDGAPIHRRPGAVRQ